MCFLRPREVGKNGQNNPGSQDDNFLAQLRGQTWTELGPPSRAGGSQSSRPFNPALVCSQELDSPVSAEAGGSRNCLKVSSPEEWTQSGDIILCDDLAVSEDSCFLFALLFILSCGVVDLENLWNLVFNSHSSTVQCWEGLIKDLAVRNGGRQLCGIFITAWQS